MKKIITTLLLTLACNLYADYEDMSIQKYVLIVATQNNINIATDKNIEKKFNFYINKKIDKKISLDVLRELLNSNGYILQQQNESYYIIKSKEDLLINKIEIFNIKYADTKKIKEKAEIILKGYFKNIKTVVTSKNQKKNITPYQERDPLASNASTQVQEMQERINYSIHVLDKKAISVAYKDTFVPQVMRTIIKSMDVKPKRIRVKIKIYEVNTDALKEFSLELGLNGQAGGLSLNSGSLGVDGIVGVRTNYNSLSLPQNRLNVTAVINALEKNGNARITAEPSIFLYEGKKAKLTEGRSFPILTQGTTVNNTGSTSTSTFTNEDTGLILDLEFEQFRSGMIYLNLDLSVNIVENYDADQRQIITIKRQLLSDLMIESGTQIDIAGLTRKTDTSTNGGVPILRHIPFIGKLFEFDKDIYEESMLVLQIKADIIDNLHIQELQEPINILEEEDQWN